jgi:hypothetical protein
MSEKHEIEVRLLSLAPSRRHLNTGIEPACLLRKDSGLLAQLVRAFGLHPKGQRFEPSRVHQQSLLLKCGFRH